METMKHALHSAEHAFHHQDSKSKSGQEPISGVRGKGTVTDPYDAGNALNQNIRSRYDAEDTCDPTVPSSVGRTEREPYGTSDAYKGTGPTRAPGFRSAGAASDELDTHDSFGSRMGGASEREPTYETGGVRQSSQYGTGDAYKGTGPDPTYGAGGLGAASREYDTRDTYGSREPERTHPAPVVSSYTSSRPTQQGQDLQTDLAPSTESGRRGEVPSSGGIGAGNTARTSQQYPQEHQPVKSTGFASDGGDFDATQPGAGREAGRLLEQSGDDTGRRSSKAPPKDDGGLWTGNHKSGLSFSKAKEKLGIHKH